MHHAEAQHQNGLILHSLIAAGVRAGLTLFLSTTRVFEHEESCAGPALEEWWSRAKLPVNLLLTSQCTIFFSVLTQV